MAIARGIGVGKGGDKRKGNDGEAVGCLHLENKKFDSFAMTWFYLCPVRRGIFF
jgi:hypothetical protein